MSDLNESYLQKTIKRIVFCTAGAALMAFNLQSFVRVGSLFPGGGAGLTLLILRFFDQYLGIALPYTMVYIPVNLIPIYIGLRYLGKHFTFYSIYVIILSSFLTDLMPDITIVYDPLLVTVFGGILNGVAISLCLYVGASMGGTDFISIYLSQKKGIDAWNYILMGNIVMLCIAGLLFGFEPALYSIIFQFCTTQVIHMLYKKYQKQTLFIITEMPNAVYGRIKEVTHHDATLFKGMGCYKGVERNMLYSVVSSEEVNKVLSEIKSVDPKAFVNVVKTDLVDGRFYSRPHD